MKLIVNADDFGLRDSVNESVALSAERGVITSATMMVKRSGFEGAAALCRELKGRVSVGIHLDLDEHFLFDEAGRYGMNEGDVIGTYKEIIEEKRKILEKDTRYQIRAMRGKGIEVSHLDGHHHVHLFMEMLGLVLPILKEEGIFRIRFHRGFYETDVRSDAALRIVREYGIRTPDAFYDLSDLISGRQRIPAGKGIAEVMAHTDTSDNSYGRMDQHRFLMENGLRFEPATFYDL